MTRFKICGLRNAEHAVVAAEAGAEFLGFNFVEGVRRQIAVDEAQAIIDEYRAGRSDAPGPGLVGLFADQPAEFVADVVEQCGLDYVQLCGSEDAAYWDRMPVPVLRQVRVRDDGDRDAAVQETVRRARSVVDHCQMPLLDTFRPGAQGGTGHTFDWTIAAEVTRRFKAVLAGGLTPENVGHAIVAVRPWCVDVSSGVETGGIKDASRIRAFADAVRAADAGATLI